MRSTDHIDAIRAFNRYYTRIIGLLEDGLLNTQHSLPQARVIFELAQAKSTRVGDLRQMLGIDAGYLSRLLSKLEADGVVERTRSAEDGRRQELALTKKGRQSFGVLNARSTRAIGELVSDLSEPERDQLVSAMRTVRSILEPVTEAPTITLREPRSGDFGWVVHRHGVLYQQAYGWDETFESLVARIVADFIDHLDPDREAAWIAEADGEPAGSIFCAKKSDEVAQLRLLLVEPHLRGIGIGTRLVEECVGFARRSGYRRMMLWTNSVLDEARRIYEAVGFELIEEEAHHSFGHDLIGQNWWLDL